MTTSVSQRNNSIVPSAMGYDAVAPFYDSWKWSKFWKANEQPVLKPWFNAMPDGPVLDAGGGTGKYRALIQQTRHEYIGVDLSGHMLEVGAKKAIDTGDNISTFHIEDIRQIPLLAESVNTILCTRTLSHVEDIESVFKEFKRVLRNGGLAIISDIHPDHPYEYTSINTSHGKVNIETHKHKLANLIDTALSLGGVEVLDLREFKFSDLIWKPKFYFDKLYKYPLKPVFYTLTFHKK